MKSGGKAGPDGVVVLVLVCRDDLEGCGGREIPCFGKSDDVGLDLYAVVDGNLFLSYCFPEGVEGEKSV